jgi:hypothetical protein
MYRTLLIIAALSFTNDGHAQRPAIAEKTKNPHRPAVAECDWRTRIPPERFFALAVPDTFKDLSNKFPIKTGMTRAEVAKAVKENGRALPAARDRYELSGGKPLKRLPEDPLFVVIGGRGDYLCLVFLKEDRVESIWCQWYITQFPSAFPPFVLSGDPKPRKAIEEFFDDGWKRSLE